MLKLEENRVLTSASPRTNYLNHFFQPESFVSKMGLEYGPYDRPYFPRKVYKKIKYTDVFSTVELRERASQNCKRSPDLVEEVDYVIGEQSISELVKTTRFDFIFCSHVLEHIPNLIKTLHEIENILSYDGVVLIAYPDKRYTFDITRSSTSVEQLVNRYENNLEKPDPETVYDYFCHYRSVYVGKLWRNLDGAIGRQAYSESFAKERSKEAEQTYIDVHCNIFSDVEFLSVISDLRNAGLISLEVIDFMKTTAPRNEFLLKLKKA